MDTRWMDVSLSAARDAAVSARAQGLLAANASSGCCVRAAKNRLNKTYRDEIKEEVLLCRLGRFGLQPVAQWPRLPFYDGVPSNEARRHPWVASPWASPARVTRGWRIGSRHPDVWVARRQSSQGSLEAAAAATGLNVGLTRNAHE